jgi:chemotaxis protein MotB
MDEKHPEIIIIKRHSSHEEEHHGGAWKIAFADFMTAMMAFFLVLWIINATDKNTKTIVARYFNPLKLEDMAKAKKGIRQTDGNDFPDVKSDDQANGSKKTDEPAPPAPKSEQKGPTPDTERKTPATEPDRKEPAVGPDRKEPAAKENAEKSKEPVDVAHPKAVLPENTLFSDPLASLDKIAGKAEASQPAQPSAAPASAPADASGSAELDAIRDPFKPWSADTSPEPAPDQKQTPAPAPAPAPARPAGEAQQAAPAAEPHPDTNVKAAAAPPRPVNAPAAEPDHAAAVEAAKLQSDLAKAVRAETLAQPAPKIEVQATPEGLLISLTDEYNFSMFAIGSAEPQAKVVRIVEKIAQILKTLPGPVVVRGHTDGRQYRSGTYDNWRLSSARAQMTYYMLIRGGLDEKRFDRIEGHADRQLKTPGNPDAAENRRIEILVRKEKP